MPAAAAPQKTPPSSPRIPAAARFKPTLFELRNYSTTPGRRDALIDMFERVFLDAYERGGAKVIGTFRVAGDPDRWVWMRAFRDAARRGVALTNFYESAAWKELQKPANATIAAIDYAMLLKQRSGGAFDDPAGRLPAGAEAAASDAIVIDIHLAKTRKEVDLAEAFEAEAAPLLDALGAAPFATFVTDRSENSYPRQRVRKAAAFVTMTRFESRAAYEAFAKRLARHPDWTRKAAPALAELSSKPLERLVLQPTARSSVR